jgi:hypothetical protein
MRNEYAPRHRGSRMSRPAFLSIGSRTCGEGRLNDDGPRYFSCDDCGRHRAFRFHQHRPARQVRTLTISLVAHTVPNLGKDSQEYRGWKTAGITIAAKVPSRSPIRSSGSVAHDLNLDHLAGQNVGPPADELASPHGTAFHLRKRGHSGPLCWRARQREVETDAMVPEARRRPSPYLS